MIFFYIKLVFNGSYKGRGGGKPQENFFTKNIVSTMELRKEKCIDCGVEFTKRKSNYVRCSFCFAKRVSGDRFEHSKMSKYRRLKSQVGSSTTRKVFMCEICGEPTVLMFSQWNKRHLCQKCEIIASEYPNGWTESFKDSIRLRDGYVCQVCGMTEEENGKSLDVHHIDYDKHNLLKNNLISLCVSCHSKTNGDRDYWQAFLGDKIKCLETE